MAPRIDVARIEEAARVIDPVFLHSPQFVSDPLSSALGTQVLCKVECLNPIRSFKGRGASYFIYQTLRSRSANAPRLQLICASAGNFGQGLAYAARAHGAAVTVFAAESANSRKIERMRELGADVQLAGADFDAAKVAAREHARTRGDALFVEDGHEPAITEGAGTIAVELMSWPDPIDVALVPLGNGALLAGIATWLDEASPGTRVIGVAASGAPSMYRSWLEGHVVRTDSADTIADGIAVRVPVPAALGDLREIVDDVLLVDDAALIEAMRLVHGTLGLVTEPAGVAGIAALLSAPSSFAGALVATPICGSNLLPSDHQRWLAPT